MAVGLTPHYIEERPLEGWTPEQYLVLAHECAVATGWRVDYLSHNGLIAYTDNGILSWNAEVTIKIVDGTFQIKSASTGNEMMDWGKNKKNVAKFLANFDDLQHSFTSEQLDARYQELKAQLVAPEEDILILPPPTTSDSVKGFFSIFIPTPGYFVTPIFINLNIFIFILMVIRGVSIISPDNLSLLNWGASFRPLVLEGQWWRLFTACFIHIGIIHLLMNMYALLYIGVLLEPILGKLRFLAAYLLTGIAASVISLWWHDLTISAGASGAIFGMYGVFLALLTTNLIDKSVRKSLLSSILVFVVFNLIYGLQGNIDNAAHIGGLISGLVIGYALVPSLKNYENSTIKLTTISVLTSIVLVSSYLVYTHLPNDYSKYDEKMKEFVSNELMALHFFNLPHDTPKEKQLSELKDKGIYYWNQNLELIEQLNALDVPEVVKAKNDKLLEYCQLRISSYELIYKAIEEDTDIYDSDIEAYNNKINQIINDISNQ